MFPKLFWPTLRKNCSSDRGKLLRFEAEGQEFAKILRPRQQFFLRVSKSQEAWWKKIINDILFPKLFWPTLRKNCSSDRGKLLRFEAEGQEFAKILRSRQQFIETWKGQCNFWNRMFFWFIILQGFSDLIH